MAALGQVRRFAHAKSGTGLAAYLVKDDRDFGIVIDVDERAVFEVRNELVELG